MGLKGKFIRYEGTGAIFGSQKKPEWKGIDVAGSFNRDNLTPGEYYDLELADNRLVSATKLAARAPGSYTPSGGGSGQQSYGGNGGNQINNLMASATGFAKSCMESGICKTPREAAQAGMKWAALWSDQAPKWPGDKTESPKPASAPDDPNDEIPF